MFKLNKGSSLVILIISIVIVVLVALSIGGVILWKYLQKPEKESRDKKKDEVEDCGVSRSFLSVSSSLMDIDFGEDEAMICMGENMQDRCKESEALVKLEYIDMLYEISGTSESNCKIKVGYFDQIEMRFLYIECSVLELASFIKEKDLEFEEKLSGTPEDYAGSLFMTTILMGSSPETLAEAGCVTNVPENYADDDNYIKSDLAQLRTIAEMHYFDNDDSYAGFAGSSDLIPPECSDSSIYIIQISPNGQSYLAYAKLCEKDVFWCVDSAGFLGEVTDSSIPYNIYTCP